MDSLPLFLCTINPKEIRSKFFDTSHYRNTTVVKGSRPERGSTSAVNCQKEKERGREREGGGGKKRKKRKKKNRFESAETRFEKSRNEPRIVAPRWNKTPSSFPRFYAPRCFCSSRNRARAFDTRAAENRWSHVNVVIVVCKWAFICCECFLASFSLFPSFRWRDNKKKGFDRYVLCEKYWKIAIRNNIRGWYYFT